MSEDTTTITNSDTKKKPPSLTPAAIRKRKSRALLNEIDREGQLLQGRRHDATRRKRRKKEKVLRKGKDEALNALITLADRQSKRQLEGNNNLAEKQLTTLKDITNNIIQRTNDVIDEVEEEEEEGEIRESAVDLSGENVRADAHDDEVIVLNDDDEEEGELTDSTTNDKSTLFRNEPTAESQQQDGEDVPELQEEELFDTENEKKGKAPYSASATPSRTSCRFRGLKSPQQHRHVLPTTMNVELPGPSGPTKIHIIAEDDEQYALQIRKYTEYALSQRGRPGERPKGLWNKMLEAEAAQKRRFPELIRNLVYTIGGNCNPPIHELHVRSIPNKKELEEAFATVMKFLHPNQEVLVLVNKDRDEVKVVLREVNDQLTKENADLRRDNADLQRDNTDLQRDNAGLREANAKLAQREQDLLQKVREQEATIQRLQGTGHQHNQQPYNSYNHDLDGDRQDHQHDQHRFPNGSRYDHNHHRDPEYQYQGRHYNRNDQERCDNGRSYYSHGSRSHQHPHRGPRYQGEGQYSYQGEEDWHNDRSYDYRNGVPEHHRSHAGGRRYRHDEY